MKTTDFNNFVPFYLLLGLQKLLLQECGVKVSVAAIKKVRWKLGWRKHAPKYCQAIREPNRVARLAFCERLEETGETFNNVIFTDETSIWLEGDASQAKAEGEAPVLSACLGGDLEAGSYKNPHLHRDNEEGILR